MAERLQEQHSIRLCHRNREPENFSNGTKIAIKFPDETHEDHLERVAQRSRQRRDVLQDHDVGHLCGSCSRSPPGVQIESAGQGASEVKCDETLRMRQKTSAGLVDIMYSTSWCKHKGPESGTLLRT